MTIEEEMISDLNMLAPFQKDNIAVEVAMRAIPGGDDVYTIRVVSKGSDDKPDADTLILRSYRQVQQLTAALCRFCNGNGGLQFLFENK